MPLPADHGRPRWRLEEIRFDSVDVASVRNDEFLFLTLAAASFVEILADTYSANLIEHFRGNHEVTRWLGESWKQEEVQHGRALKAYVQTVWPEFDWECAHLKFQAEYAACCTVEQLEPQPALELVARCVVETGTSTFYRALHHYVREPVLRGLIEHIKADEGAHYAHFRRHFAASNASEQHGVAAVLGTMWRRMREVRSEDAYIAFKHVHAGRHPGRPDPASDWQRYTRTVKRLAHRHYPYSMAVRMLIKPIPMSEALKWLLLWPLLGLALLASATWG